MFVGERKHALVPTGGNVVDNFSFVVVAILLVVTVGVNDSSLSHPSRSNSMAVLYLVGGRQVIARRRTSFHRVVVRVDYPNAPSSHRSHLSSLPSTHLERSSTVITFIHIQQTKK